VKAAMVAAAAVLLVASPASPAYALGPLDVLAEPTEGERAARLDTGLQNGVVGYLAYAQRLPRVFDRDLAFEVRLGMPLVDVDVSDLAVEGGAQVEILRLRHGFRLLDQVDLTVRTVDNTLFRGVEIALRDTLAFGWYARRGFAGVDLGWEQGLSTHIHHSDWYREDIYPDAEDGWIAFPSGRLRFGLYGGGDPTPRLRLAARLGLDVDRTGRTDFVPIVAVATVAWRF
jgi:hypothetical protein